MIEIVYEPHATSLDNESGLASGHFDVELSELGKWQAVEMGKRYENESFDAIFTSDLKRAYQTAGIAFAGRKIPMVKAANLREIDYGDLTRHPNSEVEPIKMKHILIPFPKGESYAQAMNRVISFLDSRFRLPVGRHGGNGKYNKILIIGHRAPWYALENLIHGRSLEELIKTPWKWQPGWRYIVK